MRLSDRSKKWLDKKVKLGFRGYPCGTVAFYGPDDTRASKVAVGIIPAEGAETSDMRRWLCETGDARRDPAIIAEIADFLSGRALRTVGMVDRIIGCPHEEGVDYPDGQTCPQCPYWAGRDRFTGELIGD